MAAIKSRTLLKLPRRIRLRVISPNHRSTKLSQEELVGVKCRWNRAWRLSQLFTAGCLCVA